MRKLLKPSCIGFNILVLVTFLILGLFVGGMIESGKDHGLAGGAIVLGWGVLFGGLAFFVSFFVAYYLPVKTLVRLNWILLVLFLASCGYMYLEAQKKLGEQQEKNRDHLPSPTTIAKPVRRETMYFKVNSLNYQDRKSGLEESMGMGLFSPDFAGNSVFYFYGSPNLEKSVLEHTPGDSLTFTRNEFGQFEIAAAPPWVVPEVMKLDYELLYFKLVGVGRDFAEIIVNSHTRQTAYVDRAAGETIYWPDFFLRVNSVEFLPDSEERVRVRPFMISDPVNASFEFMRPIKIAGDWMEVLLLDSDFAKTSSGWIQWKRGDKLLVTYNLLS